MEFDQTDTGEVTFELDSKEHAQPEATASETEVAQESTFSTDTTQETETETAQPEPEVTTDEPEPASPDTTPAPTSEEVLSRYLQDQYGVATVDELVEAQLAQRQPVYSDTVKKLIEWESKGLKSEDYFTTQTQNFDEMPDVEVVKNYWALTRPKLTPHQIDLLAKKKFTLDEDEFDEETIELSKIELMDEADKARTELKKWQVEKAQPVADTTAQAQEQQLQEWHKTVDQFAANISKIDVPLDGKGDTFSYAIDNKEQLLGYAKNLNSFFSDYVATDAKGNPTYKMKELIEDISWAKGWRKKVPAIAAQARAKGIEQVRQELNNSSIPTQKDSTPAPDNSIERRLGELYFGS